MQEYYIQKKQIQQIKTVFHDFTNVGFMDFMLFPLDTSYNYYISQSLQ